MNVTLCNCTSEANIIGKSITDIVTRSCTVKGDISHEAPVIILAYDGTNIEKINYMKIPALSRSYFITDIINLTGGRYEIRGRVDVLESFKNQILNMKCIIDKQENQNISNMYLNDGSFISSEKEFIYTKTFPDGFLDDGKYILITAGGIATS